ncbi:MAG: polysaccharide pyruvyl transferase family protein [Saprospiraceae bacterium]|nr:polysaccharide pyruvyl transferase family protein [Saprospiraceae bacterium]
MIRREFLKKTGHYVAGMSLVSNLELLKNKEELKILVVSGWQDINIGDIAHTPGLLHILQSFLPKAEIVLWKKSAGVEVGNLIKSAFPKVNIVYGAVDSAGKVDNPEIIEKFRWADILIHGSGPSVVGRDNLKAWSDYSDKPYGIFGVTIQDIDEALRRLLSKASFIYTRETASLKVLEKKGLKGEHIQFAPDATFYLNLVDEEKATEFLRINQLEEGKFICVIPRLRFTPYHKLRKVNWTKEHIEMVERVNAETKERDHAKLRMAMISWVEKTGQKVLVCPEMTYQVDIMDELLINPLPEQIKPHIVKRGYWMPGEAASIYRRAHTIISCECHSPIIALANGTPAFYVRQPTDTIKGQMYYDLGLSDWVFEIEERSGMDISNSLMQMVESYPDAKGMVKKTNDKIQDTYSQRVQRIPELIAR